MPQANDRGIRKFLPTRRPNPRKLHAAVEALENRQLLSTISLVNGVLTLTGDSNRENHLYVAASGLATANGNNRNVSISSVKKIVINGGPLGDRVWVDPKLTIPAIIQTFDGADSISSGSGNDSIVAGNGNDAIYGNGGNDTIVAGDGNDHIDGGDGNDLINCGSGSNHITGGNGNDTLTGGSGGDTIIGGSGNDRITSGGGNDSLEGDAGNDSMYAGDGNDTLIGGGGNDILDGSSGSNTYPDLSSLDMAPAGTIKSPAPQPAQDLGGLVPGGVQNINSTVRGFNHGDSSAPTPVIQMIGATGAGPHAVFVHALDSTLAHGDPLTAHYQWNFGDPSGRFNTLTGWNAAHTYDQPGNYTLRLTLTNDLGKTSTLSTTVTVTGDTRRTIYVDTNGSDNNTGLSPGSAVRTINRATALAGDGVRILFHTGETFSVNAPLTLPYRDVLVGSYGGGANPVLMRVAGTGTSMIGLFDNSTDIVVQDLTFDSGWKAVNGVANKMPADGIFVAGEEITVRRCTFLNVDDAIDGDREPEGTLVEDCTAPLTTGVRGYFIWGQGTDQVYLGNYAANSTREHIVRTVGVNRMLIANNNFTNLDRSSVDNQDNNKGVIDVHRGTYAYVSQNYVYDGELRAGPRGGPSDIPGSTTSWTVFEGNHVFNHEIQIYPGTQHLMIRNNVITMPTGMCIDINPASDGRNIADIRIFNNTGVTTGNGGQFLYVYAGAPNGSISVANNLWVAPNAVAGNHATAGIFVAGKNLSEFAAISHNVWQRPHGFSSIMYIAPTWTDQKNYVSGSQWNAFAVVDSDVFADVAISSNYTPSSSSAAASDGSFVAGVFNDLYGSTRPGKSGRWSAGAVQV
jgi:hypothetical protein